MIIKNLFLHKTKYQVLIKFIALLVIFVGYFIYLGSKFDPITGSSLFLLTWSFFVLCTPIADAGFLIDFPMRLIFGIRMLTSEIFVWITAITINILTLTIAPDNYDKIFLTTLLKKIITTPYPYWAIIILSATGGLLSIRFGDELMDVATHKERTLHHKHSFKQEILMFIGIFTLIFFGYHHLLESLKISL